MPQTKSRPEGGRWETLRVSPPLRRLQLGARRKPRRSHDSSKRHELGNGTAGGSTHQK